MTPFDKIVAHYERHPCEEPFERYLLHYHRAGFVFSRPDFFAMGRPIVKGAPRELILNHGHEFHPPACDCWFVMAAAGDMGRMWSILPWELEWFCWSRIHDPLSELQFFRAETLKRLCPPDLDHMKL